MCLNTSTWRVQARCHQQPIEPFPAVATGGCWFQSLRMQHLSWKRVLGWLFSNLCSCKYPFSIFSLHFDCSNPIFWFKVSEQSKLSQQWVCISVSWSSCWFRVFHIRKQKCWLYFIIFFHLQGIFFFFFFLGYLILHFIGEPWMFISTGLFSYVENFSRKESSNVLIGR